jgi:hypothetical protein
MLPEYPNEIPMRSLHNLEGDGGPAGDHGIWEFVEMEEIPEEEPIPVPEADERFFHLWGRILMTALAVFFAIVLYTMYKMMERKKRVIIGVDGSDEYLEENLLASGSTKKKSRDPIFSINWIVRRLFSRKVRLNKRKGLVTKKSDTPRKLTEKICLLSESEQTENHYALDCLYHRARYSEEIIKRSELDEVIQLSKPGK